MLLADGDTVRNLTFALGQGQVRAHKIRVLRYANASTFPANSTTPFIIGTLGAVLLDGRVLVIDYARQRFSLCASVPDSLLRRAAFVPLEF